MRQRQRTSWILHMLGLDDSTVYLAMSGDNRKILSKYNVVLGIQQ